MFPFVPLVCVPSLRLRDPARLDYVLEAVLSAVPAETASSRPGEPPTPAEPPLPPAAEPGAGAEEPGAAPGAAVTGVELESMVSHVQDLLPDLGRGFVMVRDETGRRAGS